MGRTVILYDAACGFCRWATARILGWDRRGRLRAVPLQDPEAERLLPRMDEDRRRASWHLVAPNGRVDSAGHAVGPLLRLLPGGRPLAALAEAFPTTSERLYRWVSRHRDGLGRVAGARRCAVDPSRVHVPRT